MIPVRWQDGLPRIVRTFERLAADHPLAKEFCPACDGPLAVDEPVSLVYVGPGDDPLAQRRAAAGRPHSGAAVALHARCAGAMS